MRIGPRDKKYYLRLLGILVFTYLLSRIDINEFSRLLQDCDVSLLVFAFLLNIPLIYLKTMRWSALIRMQKIEINPLEAFLVYSYGNFLGLATPGRLGEFIKIFYLKKARNVSLGMGITSVIADRLMDLYFLLPLGCAALYLFKVFGPYSTPFVFCMIISLLSPLLIIWNKTFKQFLTSIYDRISSSFREQEKIETNFNDFLQGVKAFLSFRIWKPLFFTLCSISVAFSQCFIISSAMGLSFGFFTINLMMVLAALIALVPVSIGGLGTRDAALIYLFALFGVSGETAMAYSFLVFILLIAGGGMIGLISWWIKPLDYYH